MGSEEILATSNKYDTSDWYADLVQAHSTKLPEGAITVEQFAIDTGLSESTARKILKEKMETEESFLGEKRSVGGYFRWVFWENKK